jgi:hypothetical protein
VSFLADTFVDTAKISNGLPVVSSAAARAVDVYVADTVQPTLSTFTLDINVGILELTFSEPVDMSTFQPNQVGIQKARNNNAGGLLIDAASSVTQPDGHILSVQLTLADLDFLLLDSSLAASQVQTYVSMAGGCVVDTAGTPNQLVEIANNAAQSAGDFTDDTTPPALLTVALDMDLGKLTLGFSEYINAGAVDVTQIGVFNATGNTAAGVYLDGGSAMSQVVTHTKTPEIVLSLADLNKIKDYRGVGTGTGDTWVRLLAGTFLDLSGNTNDLLETNELVQASAYVADVTKPELQQYTMDMDTGNLALVFSETMDEDLITWSGLRLQEFEIAQYGEVFDFISPVVTPGVASTSNILYVALGEADMGSMKKKGVGFATDKIWLSMDEGAFKDMAGLDVEQVLETGITGGASMATTSLVLDASGPALQKWRVDRSGDQQSVLKLW